MRLLPVSFTPRVGCSLALVLTVVTHTLNAQSPSNTIAPADIDRLTGSVWTGTLEYRDYTTNKQTTIRSTLAMSRLAADTTSATTWEMRVGYNDEPNENSRDTVRLSADGRSFRDQRVVERTLLSDGTVRIVTEQDGEDNERPARLRYVYLISATEVAIQKLVRYSTSELFAERHIYRWRR